MGARNCASCRCRNTDSDQVAARRPASNRLLPELSMRDHGQRFGGPLKSEVANVFACWQLCFVQMARIAGANVALGEFIISARTGEERAARPSLHVNRRGCNLAQSLWKLAAGRGSTCWQACECRSLPGGPMRLPPREQSKLVQRGWAQPHPSACCGLWHQQQYSALGSGNPPASEVCCQQMRQFRLRQGLFMAMKQQIDQSRRQPSRLADPRLAIPSTLSNIRCGELSCPVDRTPQGPCGFAAAGVDGHVMS